MQRIINAIPTMSDQQLLNLFKNAVQLISRSENPDAQSVLAAIEREWKQRLDRARDGKTIAERPSRGMLQELGYKVGESGERTPTRRQILTHLLEHELPLVGSPSYTDEWGTPNSPKRYWKLVRFFESQLTNRAHHNRAHHNMDKAMIEWSEDLEWVQRTYAHLGVEVRPAESLSV
jgi:hypothetical protein